MNKPKYNFTVQSYLDVKLLADILRLYRIRGDEIYQPVNSSDLVRDVLTAFRDKMAPEAQRFTSDYDALEYLESEHFSTRQAGRRAQHVQRMSLETEPEKTAEQKRLEKEIFDDLGGGEDG